MSTPNRVRGAWACLVVTLMLAAAAPTSAQTGERRFQVGVQLTTVASGEFDDTDTGFGGRVSWHPVGLVGVEAEVGLFPGDFAARPAFSRHRIEGLFGVTLGPRIGRLRPFARLRPGFVRFGEAPRPFACIAIFPPPLPCALAGGKTVSVTDLGGGAEWISGRAILRLDVGDRLVRYPGPAFTSDRTAHQDAFVSHDLRVAVGAGLAF
jgi:hypothetical protein